MQFFTLTLFLLSFTALSAAGPLRRGEGNGALWRRFENITTTTAASDTGLRVIPIPHTSVVSFETDKFTTIARTNLIPISSLSISTSSALSTLPIPFFTTISLSGSSSSSKSSGASEISPITSISSITASTNSQPLLSLSPAISILTTTSSPTATTTGSNNSSSSFLSSTKSRVAFTASPLTLAGQASSTFLSVPSSSPSPSKKLASSSVEFPLTDITSQPTSFDTSSIVSPVTDTFSVTGPTPQFPTTIASSSNGTTASDFKTVITYTMPTNSPSLSGTKNPITTPTNTIISKSSVSTLSSVSVSSVTQIPTVISSLPSASTSISATTFAKNLAMAKGFNALFSSITPSSNCVSGSIACINGQTANCDASGAYKLAACEQGKSCFALPMNTTDGVYVGCFNIKAADSILGAEDVSSVVLNTSSTRSSSSAITLKPSPSTTKSELPQTFNTISVTIPTASPGVVVPTTPKIVASSSDLSPPITSSSEPDAVTTTIKVHQTSTTVVYVTPSLAPSALPSSKNSAASQTTPVAGEAGSSTISRAGSLITIIPMNPNQLQPVTVTVTATVTTTERIKE